MAIKVRPVRAVGATGSVMIPGIHDGIPIHEGDQYTKPKHQVYVPEHSTCQEWEADGTLTDTSVLGYSDLDYTEDVQRQLLPDGSITAMLAAGYLSAIGSYDDATIARGSLTSAVGTYPADLVITGLRLYSEAPVLTSVFVRAPATHAGTTGGATKNTAAALANQLILRDPTTLEDITIYVTAGVAVPNARIVKEIMLGAIDHGLDVVGAVTPGNTIALSSPLSNLIIRPCGLATVLGWTAGTYTPTDRGSVNSTEIVAAGGTVVAATITVPAGLIAGMIATDYVFVMANDLLCQRNVTFDGTTFAVNFVVLA